MIEKQKLFFAFVSLLILAAAPAYSGDKPYDLGTQSLMHEMEAYLHDHGGENTNIDADLRFHLARFYIHTGQEAKAEEYKEAVSGKLPRAIEFPPGKEIQGFDEQGRKFTSVVMSDPIKKAFRMGPEQLDIGALLEAAKAGNDENIFETVKAMRGGRGCEIAMQQFVLQGKYDAADKVALMPECKSRGYAAKRYRMAALLVKGEFRKAFEFSQAEKQPSPIKGVIDSCLSEGDGKDISKEDLAFLEQEKEKQIKDTDDTAASFLGRLLAYAGREKESGELAGKIHDTALSNAVMRKPFESAYLSGNREKAFEAAQRIRLADTVSGTENPGYGGVQWWATSVPGTEILVKNPSPLAYELALTIKDDRARFKTLLRIYEASKKKDSVEFPGCKGASVDCLIAKLTEIADKQNDDYMYGRIVDIQKDAGKPEEALQTYRKVKNPDAMLCYFDACFSKMATPPPQCTNDPEAFKRAIIRENNKKQQSPASTLAEFRSTMKGSHDPDPAANISNIVACDYESGRYLQYLDNPASLEDGRDFYMRALTEFLEKKKRYDLAIRAISAMTDSPANYKQITGIWMHVSPLFESWSMAENPGRTQNREAFLKAAFESSYMRKPMWDVLLSDVEFSYWNHYDTRTSLSVVKEKKEADEIWVIADKIRQKVPEVKAEECAPASPNQFPEECDVMRFVAQGKEQEAMAKGDASPLARAMTARLILSERFLRDNAAYREATGQNCRDCSGQCPFTRDELLSHGH